ncbi:hypothetical protein JTB14_034761, partial [Gonioctena quinquepunctata]
KNRNIDIAKLENDPDKNYDLLGEIGRDLEIDSDRDEQWGSNEHEEQIEQAEEMDVELGEESSVENGEFDDEDNIPQSFFCWQKCQMGLFTYYS